MHDVLRRIGAGEPWQTVTTGMFGGQGSYGNGAAMRVAPLGAWYGADLDTAAEQARRSARVTHAHPEAEAGAVAVAVAAGLAAAGAGEAAPTRADFLCEVAGRLPDGDVRSGSRVVAARTGVGGVPQEWWRACEEFPDRGGSPASSESVRPPRDGGWHTGNPYDRVHDRRACAPPSPR